MCIYTYGLIILRKRTYETIENTKLVSHHLTDYNPGLLSLQDFSEKLGLFCEKRDCL